MSDVSHADMLDLAARIVAAHVENNSVQTESLPDLIKSVFRSLATAAIPRLEPINPPVPAVPIKRSVLPDYIICLEDGRKLKMLKRHLKIDFNLTPTEYRAKWGLPHDYPMVAPNYAVTRSGLAISAGLGRKPKIEADDVKTSEPKEPEVTVLPTRRARGSKG